MTMKQRRSSQGGVEGGKGGKDEQDKGILLVTDEGNDRIVKPAMSHKEN